MTPPAKYDLTELKTRLDIVEVARLCGLDPKKSGSAWVARCPAHPDSPEGRPNLAIHPTKGAKCFRCGWHADVIGLAVKAKGGDFGEVVAWLASLAGLAPAGEGSRGRRSGSGLGYNGKGQGRDMYPKGAPLPAAGDRPPAVRIIGDLPPDPGLVLRPPPATTQEEARPWAGFDTFDDLEAATGRAYVALVETTRRLGLDVDDTSTASDDQVAPLLAEYRRLDTAWAAALGLVALAGETRAGETRAGDDRPTLRVRVFDAFLGYTVPVGEVPRAAAWLSDKKGLSVETQTRAGLRWLSDWEAADKGLKAAFDVETLKALGLVTAKGRLRFWKHRLLFPFWVKGKPVFFAGRDIDAQGDDRRFDNLSGSVPCPYNADDLVEARRTGRPLFVCEGYTDCLTLTQSGRLAVALGGTQGLKPAWVADFEGLDVFLAFDGDKAGREAAQKVADLFVSEGLPAPRIVKLPDGQDVTDYFTHQRSKTRV